MIPLTEVYCAERWRIEQLRVSWHWFLLRLLLDGVFKIFLPLAARLPMRQGLAVADWLGGLCWRLDLDWRTLALREHYVSHRTSLALREIQPDLTQSELDFAVARRFLNSSREELEGHWFALQRSAECRCEFEGFDAIQAQLDQGRGIVLLTLHFDATLMGVTQIGLAGLKINLMTSNVVDDPRVRPIVQTYFRNKYCGIQSCLNGGRVMHVETHLKAFYSALRQGEGVVILGEAPSGRPEEAIAVDFLGKCRAFAPGAVRLAEKTRTPMAAFVCLRESAGRYRVIFSPVLQPRIDDHSANVPKLFGFLEDQVRQRPERWWAADQLPNFINLDKP